MLVKIGYTAVVNVTAFDKVWIEAVKDPHNEYNRFWVLRFKYEDLNGEPAELTVECGHGQHDAIMMKDEIVSQIREVEMENATQALESAMKESNHG